MRQTIRESAQKISSTVILSCSLSPLPCPLTCYCNLPISGLYPFASAILLM
jgi:hypothetical protein